MTVVKQYISDTSQCYFDSFCACNDVNKNSNNCKSETVTCNCGEECEEYEWTWDDCNLTRSASLSENKRDVLFHQTFSSGTAAVRGNAPFKPNFHYYWEIKMLTALYGTDVMVGVGTDNVDMNLWPYRFCSLLGLDKESWGYSYRGHVQHDGQKQEYGPRFGVGSIIGVHLDMCSGTLEFYHNRRPLGVAFTGLKSHRLYPMVCSTAAQSAMRVTCSLSLMPSLQLLALRHLTGAENWPSNAVHPLNIVPGLKNMLIKRFWWLLAAQNDVKPKPVSKECFATVLSDEDDEESRSGRCGGGSVGRAPQQRKRKREKTRSVSSDQESSSGPFHLSDGPSSSSQLLRPLVNTADVVFAPCETCGIVRAVGSKKSNRINKNRVCIYCDGLV